MFPPSWSVVVWLHTPIPCRVNQRRSTSSTKKERIMGKGNNSQKNDKKNKKVKKDAKK